MINVSYDLISGTEIQKEFPRGHVEEWYSDTYDNEKQDV